MLCIKHTEHEEYRIDRQEGKRQPVKAQRNKEAERVKKKVESNKTGKGRWRGTKNKCENYTNSQELIS